MLLDVVADKVSLIGVDGGDCVGLETLPNKEVDDSDWFTKADEDVDPP